MSNQKHPLLYDKAWLTQKYVEEGLNTVEIGKLIGRSSATVVYALNRLKVPRRSRTEATIKHRQLWDKKWLKQKYLEERLSSIKIAKEVGCDPASVHDALKRYEIPRRTNAESQVVCRELLNKEWLERKYIEERLSASEIGNALGCCNTAVLGALERFGISRRDQVEAHAKYTKPLDKELLKSLYTMQKKSAREIGERLCCSTSCVYSSLKRHKIPIRALSEAIKRDSKHAKLNDRAWLYQKYWVERLSSSKVAGIIGCTSTSVRNHMAKHGIPCRKLSEAQKGEMNGFHGKTHTEEARDKMHMNHVDYCGVNNPLYGRRGHESPNYGKCLSKEHKAKISNSMMGNIIWVGRKHSEETKKLMRENRKNIKPPICRTNIEVKLETIFRKYTDCIEYTGDSSFWIATPEANLNPDFIVRDKKIAIEANGNYWHDPALNKNICKSSIESYRRDLLEKVGWKLVVLWEVDILAEGAEAFVVSKLKDEGIIGP